MKFPRCLSACWMTVLVLAVCCLNARSAAQSASSPDQASAARSPEVETIAIPGPLRSFLRMAGISQKASSDEVLPLLAHNVFLQGYEGWQSAARPTEFLILLARYVHQARELTALAGPEGVIRISNCDEAKPLLHIIGYRLGQPCGHADTSLVTADAERAFITVDSGFPLPELESTLQGGKPFGYPFPASRVPVLFTSSEWIAASKEETRDSQDLLDALLRDPVLARTYWALARIEAQTRNAMQQSVGLKKLVPYAAALDFYGTHICIRSGRVTVPGGPNAEPAWKDLVGASPDSPDQFIPRLLARDRGWLAAYFDALSRINQTQQAHFTEPQRLRRFYEALRGQDTSPDAARAVFRPAPALLLLLTRMQWEPNGDPHVPGNLDVWKQIVRQKADSKITREWGKRAGHWTHPEQLLEGMFALSRVESDAGPVQAYLTLSELDARRPSGRRLTPQAVLFLANRYSNYSDQYLIFCEFPELSDDSIAMFLNVAETLTRIPNHTVRGNAMGMYQANVGLWQVLARQRQIPSDKLDSSWQEMIKPFARVPSSADLFDSGRASLRELLLASTGKPSVSQDEIIDLLAGPAQASPEGRQMHQDLANRIRSVMEGQRLVSLDILMALGDGLKEMAQGQGAVDTLLPLAQELSEFEMPRPIFTSGERTQWAAGIYNNRHTELQMHTDLAKVIKSPASRSQLEDARGQLSPFLRDTLVGLNYAYYEPPGAQVLHNNPLLVRSHDFSGDTVSGVERLWQAPRLFGEGSPAGGGAHLVGSLADLPYVLSEVEQDFIAPENVQALIWRELVPGLFVSATLPRWWGVTRTELHAIALYQRSGEELVRTAAGNEELRNRVTNILSDRMAPRTLERVERALQAGQLNEVFSRTMPADTFYVAAEFRRRFPADTASLGPAGRELDDLCRQFPTELSWHRLSEDFGVPHPILTQSYARELLNVKPFPAFEGYSSRLLAETWDSSNLYWARLADEMGYSPVMLNRLVPELTRRMVEKIFATDFEDWPAMLRALRETGEEFRQGKIALGPAGETVARP